MEDWRGRLGPGDGGVVGWVDAGRVAGGQLAAVYPVLRRRMPATWLWRRGRGGDFSGAFWEWNGCEIFPIDQMTLCTLIIPELP